MDTSLAEPLVPGARHVPHPASVLRVRRELDDVYTLELSPPGGVPAFAFAPGQFNMLYLFGHGDVAISISGDPHRADVLVHTIRAVGSITKGLCQLTPGGVVGVRGPFGTPWPVDGARGRDVVVVAGGLGLAPLRPVIYEILANRGRYGRVSLLYGSRTPPDLLFRGGLDQWRRTGGLDVGVCVDAAAPGWSGHVGVVTTLIPDAPFTPSDAIAFVCGPEVMMRFAARALIARGIAADQIFVSVERNMKCAVGVCGHCQLGPTFVCKDGPVFRYDQVAPWLAVREL